MIFFQGKNTENKKWPFNPTNILMKETINRLINVLQIYQIPAEQKQEKKKKKPSFKLCPLMFASCPVMKPSEFV